MNHLLTRQIIRACNLGATGIAAVKSAAFAEEFAAGGSVDGPVDTAAAEQRFVGCVDDGVDAEFGYVSADEADFVVDGLRGCWECGCGGRGTEAVELVEEGDGGDFGDVDECGGHFSGSEWHVF